MPSGTPNPGSAEAIEQGCKCPILDNNHGRFAPWPPDGWWNAGNCPVHPITKDAESDPERG